MDLKRTIQISRALLLLASVACIAASDEQPSARAARAQRLAHNRLGSGSAVEVSLPAVGQNRSTRTADVFQNGDGYNIFVTNTCERDSMKVNIKTSRPFYGVIHTRGQRQKASCSAEGTGASEYNLEISHALSPQDPAYCGVIRAKRESADERDTLSVVVAVRLHRTIELSDDKFFLLNCTNRCRRADCSSTSAKLLDSADSGESESVTVTPTPGEPANRDQEECTIWRFPWVITLLWCLGILLLAMVISHCIMCSSMVCRCVKTEVEEREPSDYEGATDCEDEFTKRHPYQIEYDNRDIYKTSNNYEPYSLRDTQAKSASKQPRRR